MYKGASRIYPAYTRGWGAGALGRAGRRCWFGRSLFAASATVAGLQIGRLSVVLKASAYTMYKRYLTKCVDSLKPPADGE